MNTDKNTLISLSIIKDEIKILKKGLKEILKSKTKTKELLYNTGMYTKNGTIKKAHRKTKS